MAKLRLVSAKIVSGPHGPSSEGTVSGTSAVGVALDATLDELRTTAPSAQYIALGVTAGVGTPTMFELIRDHLEEQIGKRVSVLTNMRIRVGAHGGQESGTYQYPIYHVEWQVFPEPDPEPDDEVDITESKDPRVHLRADHDLHASYPVETTGYLSINDQDGIDVYDSKLGDPSGPVTEIRCIDCDRDLDLEDENGDPFIA